MKIYKTSSFGKILISSEYFVLKGALALAIPTKFKQSFSFYPENTKLLVWESYDFNDQIWFDCIINISNFTIESSENDEKAFLILNLLKSAKKLNYRFLESGLGGKVITKLGFPLDWGLGSSSTLINNISKWAEVNPYDLLWSNFKGSGYDIACSESNSPIHYRLKNNKPIVKKVSFFPSFHTRLFFIHLNQKQKTEAQINYFNEKKTTLKDIEFISNLSKKITNCETLEEFQKYIHEHEMFLSQKLNIQTIKEKKFIDYKGQIKSLGAWGGDFILAAGPSNSPEYFIKKGFKTIIPFKKMLR